MLGNQASFGDSGTPVCSQSTRNAGERCLVPSSCLSITRGHATIWDSEGRCTFGASSSSSARPQWTGTVLHLSHAARRDAHISKRQAGMAVPWSRFEKLEKPGFIPLASGRDWVREVRQRKGESDGERIDDLFWNQQEVWSGRGDLNARPPGPGRSIASKGSIRYARS